MVSLVTCISLFAFFGWTGLFEEIRQYTDDSRQQNFWVGVMKQYILYFVGKLMLHASAIWLTLFNNPPSELAFAPKKISLQQPCSLAKKRKTVKDTSVRS